MFIISRYQNSNDKKDNLSIQLAQQQTIEEMSVYINFYFNAKLTNFYMVFIDLIFV